MKLWSRLVRKSLLQLCKQQFKNLSLLNNFDLHFIVVDENFLSGQCKANTKIRKNFIKNHCGVSTHTETVVGDHVKFVEFFESVFVREVAIIAIPFGAVPISINIVIELFVTNACWSEKC